MANRFYETGLLIGAVTPPKGEWTLDQYKERTRSMWSGVTTPFAIVAVERNGKQSMAAPFSDKEKASDLYGRLAGNPGAVVYLAYFDRTVPAGEDALIDEAFYQPTDIVHETTTVRTERVNVPTPIKAGLGIAGLLGILALIAKH